MSLELAIKEALKNPIQKRGRTSISRMATVLVSDYSSFTGLNSYKSHPLQAKFSAKAGFPERICTHSEIKAISKALAYENRGNLEFSDLSNYRMYIARVLKDDTPALAMPCPGC